MNVLMNHHTTLTVERRSEKWGIKVSVHHGYYWWLGRQRVSEGRMRAQALWVRTRLLENGDDSVRDLHTYSVRQDRSRTVVCWSGDNMRLAT